MATYDEVFAGLSPHPLVISCLRVERKNSKIIKGGNEYNHENFSFRYLVGGKKNLKIIKGGNEHNHENAEHQILARATKFPTGLYLLFMYVKYDFHRKNTVTLDQVLTPNLNVQSCRQHQVGKMSTSPPLVCAGIIISYQLLQRQNSTTHYSPWLNVLSCRQHQMLKIYKSPPLVCADLPCPGCCTDSPSCPSPSPHPESYKSNFPIFIIHKFDDQISIKLSNTFPLRQPTPRFMIQTTKDSKFK